MNGRPAVGCTGCGSLERTRVMAMYIDQYNLVTSSTRILHIAPEYGLAKRIAAVAKRYTMADIDLQRYSRLESLGQVIRLDLCQDLEEIPARSYDLIIHSHVLEHVPCNYTYVLFHLHRILGHRGRMVCSIPITGGYYDSATAPSIDGQERLRRFGQHDHITRFGRADLDATLGKLYKLDDYDLTRTFDVDLLDKHNIPESARRGFSPHTVLCLKRTDYLLRW